MISLQNGNLYSIYKWHQEALFDSYDVQRNDTCSYQDFFKDSKAAAVLKSRVIVVKYSEEPPSDTPYHLQRNLFCGKALTANNSI